MNPLWMRWTARALALLWASWWVFFEAAEAATGIGRGGDWRQALVPPLLFGVVMFGSTLVAWRWEMAGGALLALEGAAVLAYYPRMVSDRFSLATILFVLVTMALPPLVAGLLFMGDGWRMRRFGTP